MWTLGREITSLSQDSRGFLWVGSTLDRRVAGTLQPHQSALYYVSRVNQPPAANMALSGERTSNLLSPL
jgi:hypothetical protein